MDRRRLEIRPDFPSRNEIEVFGRADRHEGRNEDATVDGHRNERSRRDNTRNLSKKYISRTGLFTLLDVERDILCPEKDTYFLPGLNAGHRLNDLTGDFDLCLPTPVRGDYSGKNILDPHELRDILCRRLVKDLPC